MSAGSPGVCKNFTDRLLLTIPTWQDHTLTAAGCFHSSVTQRTQLAEAKKTGVRPAPITWFTGSGDKAGGRAGGGEQYSQATLKQKIVSCGPGGQKKKPVGRSGIFFFFIN